MKNTQISEVNEIQIVSTRLVRESTNELYKVSSPFDVVDYCIRELQLNARTNENMVAFCMNTKNRIVSVYHVSAGSVNETILDVKGILRAAILSNSSRIIIVHNHPSGDPEPSMEDIQVSLKLQEACRMMDIALLDSITVGDGYVSLKERDLLNREEND